MKKGLGMNEIIKEFFMNEPMIDSFWGGTTLYPFLSKLNNNPEHLTKNNRYSNNFPATNVFEDEWSYRFELATPGFTKKDLRIELENGVVTVWGEKKIDNKKQKGEYLSKEYHSSKFYRTFTLPENVVCDEIHGKVDNGITTLFLPKEKPTASKSVSKTIEIE